MKNRTLLFVASMLLALLGILNGCKKSSTPPPSATIPSVTVSSVLATSPSVITLTSTVTTDGGASVTARGVCWSIGTVPTIANTKTLDGTGAGTFSSSITGLLPNTNYTIRCYATNSAGTGYSTPMVYTTPQAITLPTVSATPPSFITSKSAVITGTVTADGNAPVTTRGFCWSTTPNPTIANSKTIDGSGIGDYVTTIENLLVNQLYYVRPYATNSAGTAYGTQLTFTTAYFIGEPFGGGRIFYIDNTKLHGLIAASSDPVTGATWQITTTSVFLSANAYSYTNGVENTTRIVTTMGTSGTAAAVCWNYASDGFTDWYLPSSNELNTLFTNATSAFNLEGLLYWSSTESSAYIGYGWAGTFGGLQNDIFKTSLQRVRPIRAF